MHTWRPFVPFDEQHQMARRSRPAICQVDHLVEYLSPAAFAAVAASLFVLGAVVVLGAAVWWPYNPDRLRRPPAQRRTHFAHHSASRTLRAPLAPSPTKNRAIKAS